MKLLLIWPSLRLSALVSVIKLYNLVCANLPVPPSVPLRRLVSLMQSLKKLLCNQERKGGNVNAKSLFRKRSPRNSIHRFAAARSYQACLTIAIVLILASSPAGAASITMDNLLEICEKQDTVRQSACLFYVLGAAEGAELSWLEGQRKPLFCVPDGVTNAALARVFTGHDGNELLNKPEAGGKSAVAVVVDSLEKAFPCAETHQSLSSSQDH